MPDVVRRYLVSCDPESRQEAQDACLSMRRTIHPFCQVDESGKVHCEAECIAISLTLAATGAYETIEMAFRLNNVLLRWIEILEDMAKAEINKIGETS